MSEIKKSVEVSIHPFQPLHPDTRPESRDSDRKEVISTEPKLYTTVEKGAELVEGTSSRATKKSLLYYQQA